MALLGTSSVSSAGTRIANSFAGVVFSWETFTRKARIASPPVPRADLNRFDSARLTAPGVYAARALAFFIFQ